MNKLIELCAMKCEEEGRKQGLYRGATDSLAAAIRAITPAEIDAATGREAAGYVCRECLRAGRLNVIDGLFVNYDASVSAKRCGTCRGNNYAPAAPVVPEGMVMVPREPTKEMMTAGMEASKLCIREQYPNGTYKGVTRGWSDADCAEIYKAMLATAYGVEK